MSAIRMLQGNYSLAFLGVRKWHLARDHVHSPRKPRETSNGNEIQMPRGERSKGKLSFAMESGIAPEISFKMVQGVFPDDLEKRNQSGKPGVPERFSKIVNEMTSVLRYTLWIEGTLEIVCTFHRHSSRKAIRKERETLRNQVGGLLLDPWVVTITLTRNKAYLEELDCGLISRYEE